MREALDIWVLTDGRAGHSAQSFALAEALGRTRTCQITEKPIRLKRWAEIIPPTITGVLGAGKSKTGWPFSGLAEGGDDLHWPWPDLVIGTGRRTAPITAAIGNLHGATAIQILDPKMRTHSFDALIVPRHDTRTGANVLNTTGAMSRITADRVAEAATAWSESLAHLARPRLAVLIGGPSKSARFDASDERNLVLALLKLERDHGLIISTSRRTSPALVEQLVSQLGDQNFVFTGEGDNPYPGMLGHADAVLVTKDSVNMASEAASTGLPVHVFPVSGVSTKIAVFHEDLAALGASRPFTGEIGHWDYAPLAEADRIAADLIRRGIV